MGVWSTNYLFGNKPNRGSYPGIQEVFYDLNLLYNHLVP